VTNLMLPPLKNTTIELQQADSSRIASMVARPTTSITSSTAACDCSIRALVKYCNILLAAGKCEIAPSLNKTYHRCCKNLSLKNIFVVGL